MEDKLTIETKKLSELFDVNFSLTIPDYQRAYEWRSYHVKNLLNDTYSASRRNTPYLMGTIILNQTNHSYEIIDGQQRLITLSILMNYFSDKDHATLMQAKFNNLKSFYYIKNTQNEIAE